MEGQEGGAGGRGKREGQEGRVGGRGRRRGRREGQEGEEGGAVTPCVLPPSVLTVFFYHGGCWLVYLLNLQDGARIFPVHAIR